MATARKRIDYYVGPKETVRREDLPALEATGEWVAEEKKDGFWCLTQIEAGKIISMNSRVGLPLGCDLVGERICLQGDGLLVGELCSDAVGEGEDATRTGTKRLHLFEAISWGNLDLRDLPLEERREALEMIYNGTLYHLDERVLLIERRESGFLAWYDQIMASTSKVIGSRAEGLVLKKRGTKARATNADGKVDFWLRCKPRNTTEYIVISSDGVAAKGTPKIALGLYKQTKDGLRVVKVMSPTWPAGMDLRPGMVVEVEGAEMFPSGALRHGHIVRVRDDKLPEHCTIENALHG